MPSPCRGFFRYLQDTFFATKTTATTTKKKMHIFSVLLFLFRLFLIFNGRFFPPFQSFLYNVFVFLILLFLIIFLALVIAFVF